MPRQLTTTFAAAALIGGLVVAPALYAHSSDGGSMMQDRQGDMMGQGGMMGMMNMMSQMGGMMEGCSEMMQGMGGAQRPNEQWRTPQPEQPQPDGNTG